MLNPRPTFITRPLFVALVAAALVACDDGGGAPAGGGDTSAAPADTAPPVDTSAPVDAAAADTGGAADDVAPPPSDASPDVAAPIPTEPFAAPVADEDDTFFVGPYVMHTTQTAVNVVWEDEPGGAPRVVWGRDGVDEGEVEAATDEDGRIRTATIEGLRPETVYEYRACVGDTCTATLTFATAPRAGRPFRFAVYGDSRSDPPTHRAVVDTIIESRPAVVFHTGDVVEVGQRRDEYPTMHLNPLRRLAHSVPVYVAVGNHEWKDQESGNQNFRDYLVYPKDPAVPREELSYTVTWGDTFALVMDNTMDGLDMFFPLGAGAGPPLWKWLEERATSEEAQSARWRFAFFHYPPASPCHEDWMMISATREYVVPLLRENGFHAVFVGHVHGYERHEFDGLPVFVTGGGGAGLEDEEECTLECPSLVFLSSVHHHLTVDLTAESAHVRAVDLDGRVMDEVTLAP